ncbi:MAG: sigma-54-dependent Fis family transcriptional regulator [Deltaproteobacteria bacterium]|nr:sigma-54-dependent Fis family transcriptional regulator [Deltaproteobacteria bacterium]
MSAPLVRILVAEDDRAVRSALHVNLEKAGYETTLVVSAEEALDRLQGRSYDVLLTDVRMPGMDGLALLQEVRRRWPHTVVLVMTGYGNVEDAVAAMKSGAEDYLIKPVTKAELLMVLERALESRALRDEVSSLRREMETRFGFAHIVGTTEPMQRVYSLIHAVASTHALVLLQGETGTGKELVARAIHQASARRDAPFVRVNCAALPDTLLESELFGHEKGAFTGAIRNQPGRFDQAQGGTLLLDEIGDLSPAVQVKLLHVLENGEYQRLGGRETLRADVRVIAATNKDLRQEVHGGRFRKDLFYRLDVFTIRIPPLRERRDDIPALVEHFLARFSARDERPPPRIAPRAMQRLMAHPWPGNVRELEHVLERAVILAASGEIVDVDLQEAPGGAPSIGPATEGLSLPDHLRAVEHRLVLEALVQAGGVQARAARRLGISRSNLSYRLKKLGIAGSPEGGLDAEGESRD